MSYSGLRYGCINCINKAGILDPIAQAFDMHNPDMVPDLAEK